jgi:hypothetical protein
MYLVAFAVDAKVPAGAARAPVSGTVLSRPVLQYRSSTMFSR